MNRRLTAILALLVALAAASGAHGFARITCNGRDIQWDSPTRALGISGVSFPGGNIRRALLDGVGKFNLNASQFRVRAVPDVDNVAFANGESEIWGEDDPDLFAGDLAFTASALTCFWFFDTVSWISDADIVIDFSTPWLWTFDDAKRSIKAYSTTETSGRLDSFQAMLVHELGHVAVLGHENRELNMMGDGLKHLQANGLAAWPYLGEDATDGAIYLYGAQTDWQDVGVSHWKYAGENGEYSLHAPTVIADASGAALEETTVDGELAYFVSPGEAIRVEFTFENNGANRHADISVGYYLSTNDTITTWDRLLVSTTSTLARDQVQTSSFPLTVPAGLGTGESYWLGVIIDNTDAIAERVEWNNATYIPIRIR